MWRIDADGRVVKVSQTWQEVVGHPAVLEPGYPWTDHIHPHDLHLVTHVVQTFWTARRAYLITYRVRDQHGQYVWLKSAGVPHSNGGFIGWTRLRNDRRRPLLSWETAQRVCRMLLVG